MPTQLRNLILLAALFLLFTGSRTIANFVIEYQWWKERSEERRVGKECRL